MLVSNESAVARLNSPNNLINKLKDSTSRKNAMSLFIKPPQTVSSPIPEPKTASFNPFNKPVTEDQQLSKIPALPVIPSVPIHPEVSDLLEEADAQVKLGLAHNSALDVLAKAVTRLGNEVESIPVGKLPQVITATAKVVEGIRKERLERDKIGKDKEVHYHFYTPQQKTMADYEVIDVTP